MTAEVTAGGDCTQRDDTDHPCAKAVAAWREQLARGRDLPRSWIVSDAAIFEIAQANPATREALGALPSIPPTLNANFAANCSRSRWPALWSKACGRKRGRSNTKSDGTRST